MNNNLSNFLSINPLVNDVAKKLDIPLVDAQRIIDINLDLWQVVLKCMNRRTEK